MSPAEPVAEERGRARAAPGPLAPWALALALLVLAPLAKASVPRAAATDGAALLVASLTESSRLAPLAASDDVERLALFDGDELAPEPAPIPLASRVRENRLSLHLGADAFGLEPLRGPPPLSEDLCRGDDECLAGTRIGGLTLLEPFAQKGEPKLTLELQWACSVSRCGLADGKPLDPWGLRAATRADEAQRAAILAAIETNRREAVKGGLHGSAMEDYEDAARFTLSSFDAAIEAAGTSDPVGIRHNKLFGGANGGGTYGYEFGVLPRGGDAGDIVGMTIDGALQDSAVVIARIPEFLPIVPGARSAYARRSVKGPARREVPRERYTRELPPGERRSADENALAREYYRNHRDKAIERYEKETGLQWPRDPQTGKPLWAEHPRSLKEGGNPLRVEPGNGPDPNAPHSVPGPDGLTDHQRWGALGTPAREARRRGN